MKGLALAVNLFMINPVTRQIIYGVVFYGRIDNSGGISRIIKNPPFFPGEGERKKGGVGGVGRIDKAFMQAGLLF